MSEWERERADGPELFSQHTWKDPDGQSNNDIERATGSFNVSIWADFRCSPYL